MLADAFTSVLGAIAGTFFVLLSIYIYIALIRQINARRSAVDAVPAAPPRKFGLPELGLAVALISLLLWSTMAGFSGKPTKMNSDGIVASALLTLVVVLFIAAFLRVRGFDLDSLGGFSRVSLLRAVSTGIILLLAAWPLLLVAEAVAQLVFGTGSSKQEIVDLFSESRTIQQRVLIIVLAVAAAPVFEEFIFRFFLYGVLKRFLGVTVALLANALLFAAVHAHLPSLLPLFALGAVFTLAYEWSGSILVSMTMHSLFNSVTLTVLAFPELFRQ